MSTDTSRGFPLLAAKLSVPPIPPQHRPRPHLCAWFQQQQDKKLLLLTAPAGYGKTTLAAEFLRSQSDRCVWYSLDASDNDTGQFGQYLLAAFERLFQLPLPELAGLPLEPALAQVLSRLPDDLPGWLILDDYQWLTEPRLHQALEFLLRHRPAGLRLLLLSRERPALNLSRLQLQGELAELDYRQLSFLPTELEQLLDSERRTLTGVDRQQLLNRVDGWIAGLWLLLGSYPDSLPPLLNPQFSHQQLFQFLSHEILNQLEPELRHLVETTSLLGQFDAGLAEALSGLPQAAELLHRLLERQVFLYPLDAEGRWFRYHPLFAETLTGQMARRAPQALRELQIRAAQVWRQRGFGLQALQQALNAEQPELIAELLREQGSRLLKFDHRLLLERCFELLPSRLAPELCRLKAWAAFWYEKPEQVGGCVQACLLQFPALAAEPRAELLALHASALMLNYELDQAELLADQALALLPDRPSPAQALALLSRAGVLFKRGDLPQAMHQFQRAQLSAEGAQSIRLSYYAQYSQARILAEQGLLDAALSGYRQAIAQAGQAPGDDQPYQDDSLREMALLLSRQGRFDDARACLTAAQAVQRPKGDYWQLPNRLVEGYLALCQQDWPELAQQLAATQTLALQYPYSPRWRLLRDQLQLQLWLQQQDHARLHSWQQRETLNSSAQPDATNGFEHQRQRQRWQAQPRSTPIAEPLQQLIAQARQHGLLLEELEHLALLHDRHSLTNSQRLRLLDGLLLSGLCASLYAYGPDWFERLQSQTPDQPAHQSLLRRLKAGFLPGASRSALPDAARQLLITDREWQVLQLICAGLTLPQLAERLHRSPATIKTHLKRLYAKLGVNTRAQALLAGQRLGIRSEP